MRGRHIAVEGPIGAGKTSLASILAEKLDAELILEKPEDNPFLPDYYENRKRWALQTQLVFLLSRHRAQIDLKQRNMFHQRIITDYIYEKDAIFARLALDEREFKLYSLIADRLAADVVNPDLVVFLQSSPERLLTNIKIRDRSYEREMEGEYIRKLCEIYNVFFRNWDRTPLLVIRATEIDFVNNEDHRNKLVKTILEMESGHKVFSLEE